MAAVPSGPSLDSTPHYRQATLYVLLNQIIIYNYIIYGAQYRTFLQVKFLEYSKKKTLCWKQSAKRPIEKYVRKYQNGILFDYLFILWVCY
jgi:hypothetical protein